MVKFQSKPLARLKKNEKIRKWIGEGLSKNQFNTSLSAADKKAIATFEAKYIKNQK